jgi:hypothetical protein
MIRDHNIIQCLAWLTDVHAEVKRLSPKTHLRKDAWVQHHHDDFWEFNGPDKFQTSVTASNAYAARAMGWEAYLRKGSPDK